MDAEETFRRMDEREITLDDEAPIKLEYDGYGYRWVGHNVPQNLRGLWLGPIEAHTAAQNYLKGYFKRKENKAKKVNPPRSPLVDLDLLSKKDHLLEFAELHEIEVPEDKKAPASIKAYIKKTLEKRNG